MAAGNSSVLTDTAELHEWLFLAAALTGLVLSGAHLRERYRDAAYARAAGTGDPRWLVARMAIESEWLRLGAQTALVVTGVGLILTPSLPVATIAIWVLRVALIAAAVMMAATSANAIRRHRQLRQAVRRRQVST